MHRALRHTLLILIFDNMILDNFQQPGIIRFDRTVHNHMVYQEEEAVNGLSCEYTCSDRRQTFK